MLEPQEMLALYASEAQMDKGHTVMLNSVKCHNQNIFIVVETTCPLHRSSNNFEFKLLMEYIILQSAASGTNARRRGGANY